MKHKTLNNTTMRTSTKPATILLFILFILSACSKDRIIPPPTPPGNGGGDGGGSTPPPTQKAMVHFVTNADLTGQPYHSSNLRAVITVVNDKGEEIAKDQILTLTLPNPVNTAAIELPVGDYKLSSFRLEYGSVQTHFVTPRSGSVKASAVKHPLALDFKVEKDASNEIAVEVLRIQQGEIPQQYGYPSGAFDYGQEDANPYMKVKIKAIMKIGSIVYDSLPAALTLTTWNNKGEMTTTYSALKAGINEVQVLKAAIKYTFLVSKWGTNDEMTLNRSDVDLNTVYVLGSSKEAKKLKSERVYKQIDGADVAESKTDYFYNASGNLSKIDYWLRKKDNTPYLAMTDAFEYSNGRATKVVRTNTEDHSVMTVTSFTYDNGGKVTGIAQNDNGFQTNATVEYFYTSRPEIKIHYTYPSRTFDMNYYMRLEGRNMVESSAATSHNNTELGKYSYDFNINPYVHMRWPNLFLSNNSLNNITSQQKEYYGSYPTADPYSFQYTYDADGYPTQVIKNFKSPVTGNYLFSTKTVFVY
jgi:hypothetical protein